jgi:hypothetical protein
MRMSGMRRKLSSAPSGFRPLACRRGRSRVRSTAMMMPPTWPSLQTPRRLLGPTPPAAANRSTGSSLVRCPPVWISAPTSLAIVANPHRRKQSAGLLLSIETRTPPSTELSSIVLSRRRKCGSRPGSLALLSCLARSSKTAARESHPLSRTREVQTANQVPPGTLLGECRKGLPVSAST